MNKKIVLESLINYYANGNKSLFAKKLGIKPQTINSWLSRDTFDIELIYANCENVSAEYLLTGEGDITKEKQDVSFSGDNNQVNGHGATGNINNAASAETEILKERVKSLEALLDEKERTIQILMSRKP